MKITFVILITTIVLHFEIEAQSFFNNKNDTLQHYKTFYYSTLKEKNAFRITLEAGYYLLIFDVDVNVEKVKLNINRAFDTPILYLRHRGYYSFEIRKSTVTSFNFNYQGNLRDNGSFSRLYRVTPPIIGTLYPKFKLQEISGDEITRDQLIGKVTVFLLWDPKNKIDKTYFKILDDLAEYYNNVKFIAMSNESPLEIRNFKHKNAESNFMFINDKFQKLEKWANILPGNGVVILIINEEGSLEYKNMIDKDHIILQNKVKNDIKCKLNAIL